MSSATRTTAPRRVAMGERTRTGGGGAVELPCPSCRGKTLKYFVTIANAKKPHASTKIVEAPSRKVGK